MTTKSWIRVVLYSVLFTMGMLIAEMYAAGVPWSVEWSRVRSFPAEPSTAIDPFAEATRNSKWPHLSAGELEATTLSALVDKERQRSSMVTTEPVITSGGWKKIDALPAAISLTGAYDAHVARFEPNQTTYFGSPSHVWKTTYTQEITTGSVNPLVVIGDLALTGHVLTNSGRLMSQGEMLTLIDKQALRPWHLILAALIGGVFGAGFFLLVTIGTWQWRVLQRITRRRAWLDAQPKSQGGPFRDGETGK